MKIITKNKSIRYKLDDSMRELLISKVDKRVVRRKKCIANTKNVQCACPHLTSPCKCRVISAIVPICECCLQGAMAEAVFGPPAVRNPAVKLLKKIGIRVPTKSKEYERLKLD